MKTLEAMPLVDGYQPVTRLGLGCWAIGGHGWGVVRDEDSIRALNCALEKGITFFDTADAYGLGKSEALLASVLGRKRHEVVIATKGGVKWDDSGRVWTDISPVSLQQSLENSLRRLQLDVIPLYYIHKPDNVTSIQDSVAALERFREAGKIVSIGVANFSPEQLLEALDVAPIKVIQLRFNLFERHLLERYEKICSKHKVKLVAWGVLADGLLTGKFDKNTVFGPDDHRSRMPDFIGSRFKENLECVSSLAQFAIERGITLNQLALRWVLDVAEFTLPLFGAKTDSQIEENVRASGWQLSADDISIINAIVDTARRTYGLFA
ncbi:aldo/keto reductase [Trichlorobacter ammonificans]|uniref:Aldo-keto reductase n=1 Tax=Trichlorobacter ammonificans TaxID=2916410 RepID=A0ABN8HHQ9_9BACT|nr:aldo/keto reductase [Trichlorobacter ammonificans]CAH2032334.1 Aldo-keto reductase [Trichlorobacter ammonificans]